jgi:hypothetical protein
MTSEEYPYLALRHWATRGCLLALGTAFTCLILGGIVLRGRRSEVREELRGQVREMQPLVDAIESYREEHGEYPSSLQGLDLDIPCLELQRTHSTLHYAKDCEGLPYLLVWNRIGKGLDQAVSAELVYTPGDPNHLQKDFLVLEESLSDGWTIWATVDGEPLFDGLADCLERVH